MSSLLRFWNWSGKGSLAGVDRSIFYKNQLLEQHIQLPKNLKTNHCCWKLRLRCVPNPKRSPRMNINPLRRHGLQGRSIIPFIRVWCEVSNTMDSLCVRLIMFFYSQYELWVNRVFIRATSLCSKSVSLDYTRGSLLIFKICAIL